jgi:hypothetical protein
MGMGAEKETGANAWMKMVAKMGTNEGAKSVTMVRTKMRTKLATMVRTKMRAKAATKTGGPAAALAGLKPVERRWAWRLGKEWRLWIKDV